MQIMYIIFSKTGAICDQVCQKGQKSNFLHEGYLMCNLIPCQGFGPSGSRLGRANGVPQQQEPPLHWSG